MRHKVMLNTYIDAQVKEMLQEAAYLTGISASAYVREAIDQALKKDALYHKKRKEKSQ